jgi:hypothetical protein
MQWRDREGSEPAAIADLVALDGKRVLVRQEVRLRLLRPGKS